jgi:hypothetical protein
VWQHLQHQLPNTPTREVLKSAATSATAATFIDIQAVMCGRKVADVAEKPSINTSLTLS